jgi:alkaline phosphatase D
MAMFQLSLAALQLLLHRHGQRLFIVVWLLVLPSIIDAADIRVWSHVPLTKIAFGSCHKRKHVVGNKDGMGTIWDAIRKEDPQAFLWTGDAVYPSSRRIAPLAQLKHEYEQMQTNSSIGYSNFRPPLGIFGTWDDHDYGANDAGKELNLKQERRRSFFNFLNYSQELQTKLANRSGLYHTIDFVHAETVDDQYHHHHSHAVLKVIVLDTRWNRDQHCIPSVAAMIPLGSAISCLTRWFVAGITKSGTSSRSFCSSSSTILGEEQWNWLSKELETSTAQVHVILSSIQVLSTNPAMEGWGHFPKEQERLLQLLNSKRPSGLVLLSGDVHHAEILDPSPSNKSTFLEVTSSGLTHSCTMPFYGKLCEPLLTRFGTHRRLESDYFLGRNFGTLDVDWRNRRLSIAVHDHGGETVLTTGWRSFSWDALTQEELNHVARTVDGHLLPTLIRWTCIGFVLFALAAFLWFMVQKYIRSVNAGTNKNGQAAVAEPRKKYD